MIFSTPDSQVANIFFSSALNGGFKGGVGVLEAGVEQPANNAIAINAMNFIFFTILVTTLNQKHQTQILAYLAGKTVLQCKPSSRF